MSYQTFRYGPRKEYLSVALGKLTKKLLKAIPIIGPVFVVGFAGNDIKIKGSFRAPFTSGLISRR